jgi:serine/threonine protein kinase
MVDVARGMEYLVHKGIVHCDLKDQNVLLFPDEAPDTLLSKICDFGSVKLIF